jgi:hypothetical protein
MADLIDAGLTGRIPASAGRPSAPAAQQAPCHTVGSIPSPAGHARTGRITRGLAAEECTRSGQMRTSHRVTHLGLFRVRARCPVSHTGLIRTLFPASLDFWHQTTAGESGKTRLRAPGNRDVPVACRDKVHARNPMIMGLPQSMIIEVSRACHAIMPAGAGRVEFSALLGERGGEPSQFDPGHPAGLAPPPGARPGGVRARGGRAGARQRV